MHSLSDFALRNLDEIETILDPLRQQLLQHPVYDRLDSLDSLHVFMRHHVFAVWDFMSLLKALQQRMTCVSIPWLPPENREACRLVNEIVLGEESDLDPHGNPASHFDLYLQSMRQCSADPSWITNFIDQLRSSDSFTTVLDRSPLPDSIHSFVRNTFSIIDSGDVCRIASAFTFGREDLLPSVFQRIVEHLDAGHDGVLSNFRYYLDRHIQLDAEEHGPMAHRLIASLCGDDSEKWSAVKQTARDSLQHRLTLWNGILNSL
ncbi:MAG: DUF3050 domain-containing protein [Planctomycetaceae bacterium]|nr:DUF3050 domain-containing protein [Planctomycetaceae bacterium]